MVEICYIVSRDYVLWRYLTEISEFLFGALNDGMITTTDQKVRRKT